MAFYPLPDSSPNKYVDRANGTIEIEKVSGERWLRWLYNNPVGEVSLFVLAKRKLLSDVYGKIMDSPSSADKIMPFVEEHSIDLSIARETEFISFNDFFTRKLKPNSRPIDTNSNIIVSPADGKVLAYENISNNDFIIKGVRFNLSSFLADAELAEKYKNGSLLIVRLAPYDYHRYHFPISGEIITEEKIKGDLYSVNPIALREMAEIFWINKRDYITISTDLFGDIIMAEVGATMVGSMVKTYSGNKIVKGQEKGYFKFGGSTVVLLFENNTIKIDADFLSNTNIGLETTVLMGERIGIGLNSKNNPI